MEGEAGGMSSPTEQALSEIPADQTHAEILVLYNNYPTYDKECEEIMYKAPAVVAAALIRHLSDNWDVKILDVAAGTGLVGEELKAMGFTRIDALDPSEGMLQMPKQKNIYQNYIIDFLPCEKETIKTSNYDVLVCCHGLGEGMKCDALSEMVRCVRRDIYDYGCLGILNGDYQPIMFQVLEHPLFLEMGQSRMDQ